MNFSYGKKCTLVNSMRDVSSKWAEINERAYIPEALSFCQINNHLASPARHNGELGPTGSANGWDDECGYKMTKKSVMCFWHGRRCNRSRA